MPCEVPFLSLIIRFGYFGGAANARLAIERHDMRLSDIFGSANIRKHTCFSLISFRVSLFELPLDSSPLKR